MFEWLLRLFGTDPSKDADGQREPRSVKRRKKLVAATGLLFITAILGGNLFTRLVDEIADEAPYFQDNWVPVGYQDTREDGIAAATADIKNNKMMLGKYGLVERLNYENYLELGVTPILLGCGVGGSGFDFWSAYNKTIIAEMRNRGHLFNKWGLLKNGSL